MVKLACDQRSARWGGREGGREGGKENARAVATASKMWREWYSDSDRHETGRRQRQRQ